MHASEQCFLDSRTESKGRSWVLQSLDLQGTGITRCNLADAVPCRHEHLPCSTLCYIRKHKD